MPDTSSTEERLNRQFQTSALEVRSQTNREENFWNTERDIGRMWVHLAANAAVNAEHMLPDESDIEILDTITKMLIHIVEEACKRQEGVMHFRDLYKYLEEQGEHGIYVYSLYCCFFLQAFFCQIFATASNAQGMLPMFREDVDIYRQALQFMADVPDKLKAELFITLKQMGAFPPRLSSRLFERQLDDYLAVIKEDQRKRRERDAKSSPKDDSAVKR
jgi:hypothetical protein